MGNIHIFVILKRMVLCFTRDYHKLENGYQVE